MTEMTRSWGKPSYAKSWHFFTKRGSLCKDYDYNEVPEVLLRYPENYDRICDRCLLVIAKANVGLLLGWAEKNLAEPELHTPLV